MPPPTTRLGVLGSPARATVTPWGAVARPDGPALNWWVAADDRWHTPADEPTVRQRRIDGTPVVETAVRVPGGDAVHTVYATADAGGLVIIEIDNRSSLPFAVAFHGADVMSERPPTDVPIQGIELPAGAVVFPVAHRTHLRVALTLDGAAGGRLPTRLAEPAQVVQGWVAQTQRGVRYAVPDPAIAEQVVQARSDVLLNGPRDDDTGFLIDAAERVRLGDPADAFVVGVANAAERVARSGGEPWLVAAGLDAATEVMTAAGQRPAVVDLDRLRARLGPPGTMPPMPGTDVLAWVRHAMARPTRDGADLFPGLPATWLGQGVEVHGVPTRQGAVSAAVRWHGARPALLWEMSAPARLTCSGLDPSWSTEATTGDALLAAPAALSR